MNTLATVFSAIDPNEVEGLLNRWGLNPVWISTALIVITVINLLIPVLGPFIYRLFGSKIEVLKNQLGIFKGEVSDKLDQVTLVTTKIERGLDKIADNGDMVQGLTARVDTLTDLLIDVLEYSRVPEEVKEKVKGIKVNRDISDKEDKIRNRERDEAFNALRKEFAGFKENTEKLIEKQITKKTKKR